MNKKLEEYIDKQFELYNDLKIVRELKEELLNDLQEKYDDLKNAGHDDETAYQMTIQSLGDISEILDSINVKTRELQQRVGVDFSKSNLKVSDFAGVQLKKGKFDFSNLKHSDFSNADLIDSSFKCCDLIGSNFNNANLTGSKFNASNLERAVFDYANLTNTKFKKSSFKRVTFKDNIFNGTDFGMSDLSGVCFDYQTFENVSFDYSGLNGTSFKHTTMHNVSFKTDVKKANFEGAFMDKLTYALLKGYKANLDSVNLI